MGLISRNLLSQKRSTCCGTSRSSATSLIVRKASGALSTAPIIPLPLRLKCYDALPRCLLVFFGRGGIAVDAQFQNRRWLKHHHAPRRDWNFLAGLRIAADPLALLTHHKGAEGRQLHR